MICDLCGRFDPDQWRTVEDHRDGRTFRACGLCLSTSYSNTPSSKIQQDNPEEGSP